MSDEIPPVVKSGRTRQKGVEPELTPGAPGTAKYRCTRQRQYKGRVVYPGDVCIMPHPLPKGFEEYYEKIGGAEKPAKDEKTEG